MRALTSPRSRSFVATLLLALPTACTVGRVHTRDSVLEQNFVRNEPRFERLVADLRSDAKLELMDETELRYGGVSFNAGSGVADLDERGFSTDRWNHYRTLLRTTGVKRAIRGDRGEIELEFDQASIWNGSSYKGYWYSASPPPGHSRTELDDYRLSKQDLSPNGGYFLYKAIKPNWYLYLFVDGH